MSFAAITHLAERRCRSAIFTVNAEKSLTCLEGTQIVNSAHNGIAINNNNNMFNMYVMYTDHTNVRCIACTEDQWFYKHHWQQTCSGQKGSSYARQTVRRNARTIHSSDGGDNNGNRTLYRGPP
jgi:hypothetical protein